MENCLQLSDGFISMSCFISWLDQLLRNIWSPSTNFGLCSGGGAEWRNSTKQNCSLQSKILWWWQLLTFGCIQLRRWTLHKPEIKSFQFGWRWVVIFSMFSIFPVFCLGCLLFSCVVVVSMWWNFEQILLLSLSGSVAHSCSVIKTILCRNCSNRRRRTSWVKDMLQ